MSEVACEARGADSSAVTRCQPPYRYEGCLQGAIQIFYSWDLSLRPSLLPSFVGTCNMRTDLNEI